ncbi:zinc-binding dehydrogenase [Streptomyces sp. NPDC101225]|uniref:zinc-binding dehydrogenase n=1 Tax=Streptomyces sp. NPDC101225 TaxID=3366135 RepID=UPI00380CF95F
MTAAVLTGHGGPDKLEIRRDWPVPVPGPHQVQVRVTAAAVNNTDIWTREGAYGSPDDPNAVSGWLGPIDCPRIQGGDIAGVVSALGPGVPPDMLGRRVLVDPGLYRDSGADKPPVGFLGSEADGGFAEFAVVDADHAHDMTGSPLTDEELACLPVAYGTAIGMLDRAGVRSGERLLVTGASGGVGLALVQLASARGAEVVAVTSAANAEAVRESGAAHVLLRDAEDLPAQVRVLAPDGLDAVADVVGGPLIGALMPAVRDDGRWVIAGAVAGRVVEFDLRRLYLHNITLIGSSMHTRAHFAALADAARAGVLAPRIAARYPLTRLHDAQEAFARTRGAGKIVIRMTEPSDAAAETSAGRTTT